VWDLTRSGADSVDIVHAEFETEEEYSKHMSLQLSKKAKPATKAQLVAKRDKVDSVEQQSVKKAKSATTVDSVDSVEKNKRGRPIKEKNNETHGLEKTKRGRPRKDSA
jgi:hypothetical protein